MKTKIKRYSEAILLGCFFYLTDRFYKIFLTLNWIVEEIQRKRGHKDRGEEKYSREDLIIMAMMIPNGTRLTLPEVKKFYDQLSKEHIYKLIEYRKMINENKDDSITFMRERYLRKILPNDYA